MNVVSTVRKAFTDHMASRSEEKEEPWASETNPYMRDILRYTHIFLRESSTTDEKGDALKQLGHAVYCGGIDASNSADTVLPHLLNLIKKGVGPSKSGSPGSLGCSLLLQALRTLSEILQTCKRARSTVCTDQTAIDALVDIITDVTHVRECRWACYNLHFLLLDNALLLSSMQDDSETLDILEGAADFPLWWQGWGYNYAHVLLQMLGRRAPSEEPIIS